MRIYKTEGLIYKYNEYKDYDLILSILSPEHGKISAIARGVRRPKSKKNSHIDIFNFNSFTLYKGGKGLDSISETKIKENFRIFRNKYPYHLFYLSEIIDKISLDEEDSNNIYQLIFIALKLADEESFLKFVSVIELKLLKLMGLEPQLSHFLDNGNKFDLKDKFYINFETPGYVSYGEKELQVEPDIIKCQRYMLKENLRDQMLLKIEDSAINIISKINKIWIQNSLGITLKTIKFLEIGSQ